MIDCALERGIRYFDTAPSYGDGASERILGSCLRQVRREVAICTKVGFPAPEGSAAVAAARALIRAVVKPLHRRLTGGGKARTAPAPAAPGPLPDEAHGRFVLDQLHGDLQASLEALQTDHVDCLMLHEPRLTDPTPEYAHALQALVEAGTAARIGVGTGATIETLPHFGDVAQAALTASLLRTTDSRALIAHGLFRGASTQNFERSATDSGLLDRIPCLRAHLRNEVGASALLLNCAVLGTRVERIVWSTSSVERLRRVLAAAEAVHDQIRAAWSAEHETMLADTMVRYAYGVQAAR